MGFVIADRVKETTTTTGTGSLTLAGAATGFLAFSAVLAVGDTCRYAISSSGGTEWEVGTGTLTGASTFSRDTVVASSNSGNLVNLSAGTKDVYLTAPAEDQQTLGMVVAYARAWARR